MARPEVTRKFAVGLFCGGAFHDAACTRVGGCDVVRLYDWELRMWKVARSFFPEEGVVRDMDVRAKKVGVLEADIGSAVPADGWLHLNAGLRISCQDVSKANRRPHPARLREHVATFFMVVQRLRAKYRKPEGGMVRRERGMYRVRRHHEGAVPGSQVRSGEPCLLQPSVRRSASC